MSIHPSILECRSVGKVYSAQVRGAGTLGILRGFVRRQVREHVALANIDLAVAPGEIVGLIGANGAGKTTLVKCLTGIIPASSGRCELFGHDAFALTRADKRRLSLVMGQRSQLWWDIPAIDSFRLLREIYQVDAARFERRVREQAERLDVTDRLQVQLRQLSLGERMKMEIIGAFLHDPEVVFLDEPTIGLDLLSQETIRTFLREVNRERRTTVILTSHDMADIEETCDRLVILEAGRILFDGDLVGLRRRFVGRRAVEVHLEANSRPWSAELDGELERFGAVLVREAPRALTFEVDAEHCQPFIQHLFDLFQVRDLAVERQPLENLIREIFRTGELVEAS
ncbi:MAG: ATP-binding cassette domain-containing protein [Deltaproteobacteria bacterium]|jgi:ABC-2 type transport system ATP-binding protein|nr:ATP-binding cassette domain-containing protein [Deltaproteobacteria bacterium]